ncbi:glycosyltransferase [Luminiphilus sp.]|nr:glycosyltransferase [Luminiphilus sp.]
MSVAKAVHLVHNLDDSYGGPARSIPELMHAMDEFGWCSEAVSLRFSSSERNEVIEKYDLPWKVLDAQIHPYLAFNSGLTKALGVGEPNLLHYHNIWNFVPVAAHRAGKNIRCPIVLSPRGTLFPWNLRKGAFKKSMYLKLFGGMMLERCSAIHATSTSEVDAVKKLSKTAPVALIANGVDIDEFSDLSAKAVHKLHLGLDVKKQHILYVGRIEEKKGLANLITVFAELVESGVACELVVAGPAYSKSYTDHCYSLAQELGVNHLVKWLGMVEGRGRSDVYGAADLFVLPTHSENFGMSIAEALSASLPVITTTGTPWRVIRDKGAGYIIDPDLVQLSQAMNHFFELGPGSVLEMSKAAREISEMYGWRKPAEQMSHLYNWLLGKSERPDFVY